MISFQFFQVLGLGHAKETIFVDEPNWDLFIITLGGSSLSVVHSRLFASGSLWNGYGVGIIDYSLNTVVRNLWKLQAFEQGAKVILNFLGINT